MKRVFNNLFTLAVITITMSLVVSCDIDNTEVFNEQQSCTIDLDVIGTYAWDHNPNLIFTFSADGLYTVVQDGVYNGTSQWCNFDLGYLRLTNQFDQVSYQTYFTNITSNGNMMFGDMYLIRL